MAEPQTQQELLEWAGTLKGKKLTQERKRIGRQSKLLADRLELERKAQAISDVGIKGDSEIQTLVDQIRAADQGSQPVFISQQVAAKKKATNYVLYIGIAAAALIIWKARKK